MWYCRCCWQLMTSVRHWQSVCTSTVSATCKTTFYLSVSSMTTTIHQLLVTYKCENASLLKVWSQCLCLLIWLLPVLIKGSQLLLQAHNFQLAFQPVSICLCSSQFILQHHTVKCQSRLNKACFAIRSIKLFMSLNVLRSTYFSYVHSITSHGIINPRQTSNLNVPTANLAKYQKDIYYSVIKIYNHLPTTIKDLSGDKNKFKLALQRYLLHNSFYSKEEYFNT